MKKTRLALLLTLLFPFLLAHAASANAADSAGPEPAPLFRANEVTVDLYGAYTAAEPGGIEHVLHTSARGGPFGAGLGLGYWLTENFGAMLDATVPNAEDIHGPLFDQVSLSLAARLPLGHLAPCVFGGLDRNFESGRWETHAGAGLEWRFHRRASVFVDARFVFASHATDSLMMRTGVRFPF